MKKKEITGKRPVARKVLTAVAVVILLLLVAAAAGGIYLNRYLGSEEFTRALEDEIRNRIGVEMEIGELSASILKGFTAREVRVSSPMVGDPPLLTASELVLEYNLVGLLSRRVIITRIGLVSPRFSLRRAVGGSWIVPSPPLEGARTPRSGPMKKGGSESPEAKNPWQVAIDSFRLQDGTVELFTGRKYDPFLASGLDLSGRFLGAGQNSRIEARLTVAGIDVGGEQMVSDLGADLVWAGVNSLSADLEATLTGGEVSGEMTAGRTEGGETPFRTGWNLEGVKIAPLLKAFAPDLKTEATGGIFGRVEARGEMGDSDRLTASGRVEIREGSVRGNPVQNLIAALLQDEHLQTIRFERAESDFTLTGQLATLQRLIIHSHKIIITASGTVDFARDAAMNLTVTINCHDELVGDIRVRQLRDSFQPSPDFPGYRYFDFKVWGSPDDLQNDFAERLVQRGAVSFLQEQLLQKDRRREEDPDLTEEDRSKRRKKLEEREEKIEEGIEKIFQLFGN